jgi:outer membrane protein assembly factor BamD (BamD/ComL family)
MAAVLLAMPCVDGAAPTLKDGNGLNSADAQYAIADLEYRATLFDIYRRRYFSSINQLLQASRLPPRTMFGARDDNALFAGRLNQQHDLSDYLRTLAEGQLSATLLSRDDTDIIIADLYLATGMPKAAEELLRRLSPRYAGAANHSWLAMARYYYRRGDLTQAQQALAHLHDLPSGEMQTERDSLAALVFLGSQREDEAIAALQGLSKQDQGELIALDRYNLGLALLDRDRLQEGTTFIAKLHQSAPALPVHDLADINLGYFLLGKKQPDQAASLLEGYPRSDVLSNYALLGAGWAASLKGDYRKALENWLPLTDRTPGDEAVQEGMLAVPNAYYQLKDYTRALNYYRRAIDVYKRESSRIESARGTITDGNYLDALLAANPGEKEFNALWHAETLPASPISSYLSTTVASHRFQEALINYRDTLTARELLATYNQNIDASLDLLSKKRDLYAYWRQQILLINKNLDPAALLARADNIRRDLERAETDHDVMMVATPAQKELLITLNRTNKLLVKLKNYIVDYENLQAKYDLLRGLMIWDLNQQFQSRIDEVKRQLREIDAELSKFQVAQSPQDRGQDRSDGTQTAQEIAYKDLHTRQSSLAESAKKLADAQFTYLQAHLLQGLEDGEKRLRLYARQANLGIARTTDQLITASADKDYGPAIAAYQAVLDQSGEAPFRREVMLRLAYLKMQQADNLNGGQSAGDRGDALYDEAIALLTRHIKDYPNDPDSERILYNLAKAYDHRGETDSLLDTLDRFAASYPHSAHIDEIQFRRGELLFSLGLPDQAGAAYGAIVANGSSSPFYERALYKLGWSQYKEGRYDAAVDTFLPLLGHKLSTAARDSKATGATGTRGEEELIDDIQRGAVLSVAQLKGAQSLADYFAKHGEQNYEHLLYETLARLYLEQERFEDAANVYRAFVARHPNHPLAPQFDSKVLDVYQQGRFYDLLQTAKEDFVNRYRPDAEYWIKNPGADRGDTLKRVREYLYELARYSHAKDQRSKAASDYQRAEHWYRLFLKSFPQDPLAAEMHFLLAELLYENHSYGEAAQEYEKVAYELRDKDRAAEAAYAAALAHEKVADSLTGAERQAAERRALTALLRFAETFPGDPRAAAVLSKSAQEWFELHDLPQAQQAAQRLLDLKPEADPEMRRAAWSILGHGQFEEQRYSDAEQSYRQALALTAKDDDKRRGIEENLAAAIYKQGELARAGGDMRNAAKHFLRIADIAPNTAIAATAQYDAAAALLAVEDWGPAIQILQRFRERYPDNPLQKELAPKLAVAYQKTGDWSKAAAELETVAAHGETAELKRDAVWQSADLYSRAGNTQESQRVFRDYIRRFPAPAAEAIEARQRLADLYAQQKDSGQQHYWLQQIIDADQHAGAERTDRTRLLAGRAALILADAYYPAYAAVKLNNPLKKSLALKKQVMEELLAKYRAAGEYGIAEITTAATYRTAQIYSDLGRAILDSERPKGLSALELEQYNVLLEEQAYPFEERAIALHEANARRTIENIYDDAVKMSFAALRKLLPVRYAKTEKGEAYVDRIY